MHGAARSVYLSDMDSAARNSDIIGAGSLGWVILYPRDEDEKRWAFAKPPHYTTSIHAKLPNENIIAMAKLNGGRYLCTHLEPSGHTYEGEHRTEAIARRIAALKARMEAS